DKYEPQELQNYDDTLKYLEDILRQSIALSYGKQTEKKRVCAFVGPTGTGKTTTLAKLAAHYLFDKKSKIGIITMDTYRIGATDQLKKYADIMNVSMKVATEKHELEKALANFSDREVILVDTPGRSRMDGGYLLKLRDCISTIPSVETNLVMSVTSNRKSMIDTANRFGITGYDNIIFTKLDDSDCFGYIYNVIDTISKPVPYITDGQNVPRDIQTVDPGILARIIMKNRIRNNSVSASH
ncbi:MAG TPA: flagellar biosynthesis protein FlhF, partial [Anaerolineae bacterium]|nr:flagellar biosynthesis protein FlhF [Anaerolineae bacterium]